MDLMWGTWAGHRPPSETSRFTYCLTKAQILFSQLDLSGSINRMFILDRQEYQNVDGLLVFDNTSCFKWGFPNYKSTQSAFKVFGKSQAAKNTVCEIRASETSQIWKTTSHHWRPRSWKKIWKLQNMRIITANVTCWELLIFPAQFTGTVQAKLRTVII